MTDQEYKEYLSKVRHSGEHILTQAMQELYGVDKVVMAMGPSTDEGFYFDFESKGGFKVTEEMFPQIEKKMLEIVSAKLPITREEITLDEAEKLFANNPFKMEWINEIKGRGEKATIYRTGDAFVDLCKGPHVANTSEVKVIKLLSVAGAYWHGDEKNQMLTRVYGTAFTKPAELEKYLWTIEEAKKRDHRKIGKEQGLFMISPSVGAGFPMYMPKGWLLRHALENWVIEQKQKRDYKFVWTPHVAKSDLYKQSGHWQKYDAMMSPMKIDDEEYVVKPMNCPHHFQIFNETPHSYRDLPLRLAEIATVYRYEKAGEVNGLLRVRALTQDDTHTFVRHTQISEEIDRIVELIKYTYQTFGFTDYTARISIRDPKNPNKYMGTPSIWDKAESSLEEACKRNEIPYFIGEGEAAFYGPKIDVMIKDALGREWQLTTVQLDFVQPENFDMTYIDEEGKSVRPAVLHIAILGSLDRFLGILIEHYAGAFPMWLSPVQIKLATVTEKVAEQAMVIVKQLQAAGLRVELDNSNNTLGKKSANARNEKVPYFGIIGEKEVASCMLSLKNREGEQVTMTVDEAISKLTEEIASKK
ncbi:MAG: threonine--tRNA ligase [bacterium]